MELTRLVSRVSESFFTNASMQWSDLAIDAAMLIAGPGWRGSPGGRSQSGRRWRDNVPMARRILAMIIVGRVANLWLRGGSRAVIARSEVRIRTGRTLIHPGALSRDARIGRSGGRGRRGDGDFVGGISDVSGGN